MAPFNSFAALLRKHLQRIKPERILEWGPGGSTELMMQECPNAEIVSYEHDAKWFKAAVAKISSENVFVRHANDKDYYEPGVHGEFGVIFVDGRWRNECLESAPSLLCRGGVVILHDSERVPYHKAWKPIYDILEEEEGTMVLVPKKQREDS
jgi:predicted O-methyltransferase YrrM